MTPVREEGRIVCEPAKLTSNPRMRNAVKSVAASALVSVQSTLKLAELTAERADKDKLGEVGKNVTRIQESLLSLQRQIDSAKAKQPQGSQAPLE